MPDIYTLYEAKAKLSAIVRQVREGHPVIITLHGEPAVEIRAVPTKQPGIGAKLDQMAERGLLVRPDHPRKIEPVSRRPGALKRFLADRDE